MRSSCRSTPQRTPTAAGARGAVVRRAMVSGAMVGREGVTSEKAPSASTVERAGRPAPAAAGAPGEAPGPHRVAGRGGARRRGEPRLGGARAGAWAGRGLGARAGVAARGSGLRLGARGSRCGRGQGRGGARRGAPAGCGGRRRPGLRGIGWRARGWRSCEPSITCLRSGSAWGEGEGGVRVGVRPAIARRCAPPPVRRAGPPPRGSSPPGEQR